MMVARGAGSSPGPGEEDSSPPSTPGDADPQRAGLERALRASEARWRALAATIPDTLLVVCRDGVVEYANHVPAELGLNDLVGRSVFDIIRPDHRAALRESLDRVFEDAEVAICDVPVVGIEREARWFEAHVGPVRHAGEPLAAVIVARDITGRRLAEEDLRDSECRYRTVVDHAPEAIVVLDTAEGRFVEANDNALALFGADRDQLSRLGPADVSPPTQPGGRPSRDLAAEYIAAAIAGRAPRFDWVHRSLDGREIECKVRLVRLPSRSRCLIRGSIIDVTETRRFEDELRSWQRIDALGRLANGVAHDFNNVLAVILASAQWLRAQMPHDPRLSPDVEAIHTAALSGAALTRRLLAFCRQEPELVERISVDQVIASLERMFERLLGPGITLTTVLTSDEVFILADRSQIEQVLINLVVNARDAMPAGGSLRIETGVVIRRGRPATPNRATAFEGAEATPMIRIRVWDTGLGMDEHTRRRAFEPFFTTKLSGHGSGLGLSTVLAIVTRIDGAIDVRSEPGKGTTIEIYFPVANNDGHRVVV